VVPITVDTGDQVVGGGKYMRGIVSVDETRIRVRAHIFTHVKLAGFTGGWVAVASDTDGRIVWKSEAKRAGVDGTAMFWKTSDRWVEHTYSVDPQTTAQIDRIDVLLGLSPVNRLGDIVNEGLKYGGIVWDAIKQVLDWLGKEQAPQGGPDGPPVLYTRSALLPDVPKPPLRALTVACDPTRIPHRVDTPLKVSAHDSQDGTPVGGEVWTNSTMPVDRGGGLIGTTNTQEPFTATLEGYWSWDIVRPAKPRADIEPVYGWRWHQPLLIVRAGGYQPAQVAYELTDIPPKPDWTPPED
jgi:hypothetical protein